MASPFELIGSRYRARSESPLPPQHPGPALHAGSGSRSVSCPCCPVEIVIEVSDDSPLLELLGIVPSEVSELEGGELTLTDEQLAKLGVNITVEEVCSRCCS